MKYDNISNLAHIDFDVEGAEEMFDFLHEINEINGIKTFNFSTNVVIDIHETTYCCRDINVMMQSLERKYNITSNNIFRSDVENLIYMLRHVIREEGNAADIINMINEIKQAVRGKTNDV